ncbi:hypothetical protein ACUXV3_16675 [Roseobacteraceae bacterium NS-SX3]
MTQQDNDIGAAIVRNIDLLESAMSYATDTMDRLLGQEVGDILKRKRDKFGWSGDPVETFEDGFWLSPPEWISEDDPDGNYDLFVEMDMTEEANTWLAYFAGVNGLGVFLAPSSNTLSPAPFKRVLKSSPELMAEFASKGFHWDPEGKLTLPLEFSREALAMAFQEEDFSEALAPLEEALDLVFETRALFDQLAAKIRKDDKRKSPRAAGGGKT